EEGFASSAHAFLAIENLPWRAELYGYGNKRQQRQRRYQSDERHRKVQRTSRKNVLKRNPSANISQLGFKFSTSILPLILSSHEVASSTFTPSSRRFSNSSTGSVPRRSGIATMTRCTPLSRTRSNKWAPTDSRVTSPSRSPVHPTTSMPSSERCRSPFRSRWARSPVPST